MTWASWAFPCMVKVRTGKIVYGCSRELEKDEQFFYQRAELHAL